MHSTSGKSETRINEEGFTKLRGYDPAIKKLLYRTIHRKYDYGESGYVPSGKVPPRTQVLVPSVPQ